MYCMTSTTDVCAKNVSQDKYHRGAERMTPYCLRFLFMRYCALSFHAVLRVFYAVLRVFYAVLRVFYAVLRVFLCGKENENANNVY